MGRLIKAEFRKILSTKLWWGLLIAAFILAMGWAWMFSAAFAEVTGDLGDELQDVNLNVNDISFTAVFMTRAINIATIFPLIFGGLALANEIGRKTITTSFLTAPNRPSLLGAKAITYVMWGAVFGLVIILAATLGLLIGTSGDHMVAFDVWLPIAGAGLLACILWTLLGLGVGALIGSPVATVIVLLVYGMVIGPIMDLAFTGMADGEANLAGALPNGAANGLTGSTAADNIAAEVESAIGQGPIPQNLIEDIQNVGRLAAGGLGSFGLLASLGIFLGWALLFFGLGLFRTKTRDIT